MPDDELISLSQDISKPEVLQQQVKLTMPYQTTLTGDGRRLRRAVAAHGHVAVRTRASRNVVPLQRQLRGLRQETKLSSRRRRDPRSWTDRCRLHVPEQRHAGQAPAVKKGIAAAVGVKLPAGRPSGRTARHSSLMATSYPNRTSRSAREVGSRHACRGLPPPPPPTSGATGGG